MSINQIEEPLSAESSRLAVAGRTFFERGSSGAYSLVVPPQSWMGILYVVLAIPIGVVALGFSGLIITAVQDEKIQKDSTAVVLLCVLGCMSLLAWLATYLCIVARFIHARERRFTIDRNRGECQLTNLPWLGFDVRLDSVTGVELQIYSEDGSGPAWLCLTLRNRRRKLFLCAGGRWTISATSGRDELLPLAGKLSEVLGVPVRTTLGLRYWQMLLR